MTISEDQLREWEEDAAYATEGPWVHDQSDGMVLQGRLHDPEVVGKILSSSDGEFIALSRTALPLLIEEVRASRPVSEREVFDADGEAGERLTDAVVRVMDPNAVTEQTVATVVGMTIATLRMQGYEIVRTPVSTHPVKGGE